MENLPFVITEQNSYKSKSSKPKREKKGSSYILRSLLVRTGHFFGVFCFNVCVNPPFSYMSRSLSLQKLPSRFIIKTANVFFFHQTYLEKILYIQKDESVATKQKNKNTH